MDDPGPANFTPVLINVGLLFILILINAFFAMSEIAVISLNDNKIKKMAEDGNKKAKKILKLTTDSSGFLSTIQIGVTLAGFLTSASSSQAFVQYLEPQIQNLFKIIGINNPSLANGISVVVITLITSYFSLVLGELAPKKIGMHHSERVSFRVVGILLFVQKITKPFIYILSLSTNLVVRIFGIDPHADPDNVTEEEIRMMVDVGEEKGVIEESQKEMINNIFEFDDIPIADVMTHRTDVTAVEVTDHIDEALKASIDEGFSRIPVFEDDLDNIVGVLYIKDLLTYVGKDLPKSITAGELMRDAYYVPESKKCGDLFTELTEKHIQMAIVVDEYGGTAGIITLEDLIESILGNIQDEYDDEEEDVEQLSENIFTIDGTTDIEEVSEILDRKLPKGDYETLGGMIMAELGYIPSADALPTVEIANVLFTVESLDERRIDRVRAEKLPVEEDEEEFDEDDD